MDQKKIERIVNGVTKSQRQEARRAIVKARLENNARDERRQYVVVPPMHVLDQGRRS
ncbi:MAG: hypothetical protein ABSG86_17960 [Thermoguttaceae bacterium]|jgi:hypothetical protein